MGSNYSHFTPIDRGLISWMAPVYGQVICITSNKVYKGKQIKVNRKYEHFHAL